MKLFSILRSLPGTFLWSQAEDGPVETSSTINVLLHLPCAVYSEGRYLRLRSIVALCKVSLSIATPWGKPRVMPMDHFQIPKALLILKWPVCFQFALCQIWNLCLLAKVSVKTGVVVWVSFESSWSFQSFWWLQIKGDQVRPMSGTMPGPTQEADLRPFECSICQARFRTKQYRKRHIILIHEVRLLSNEKNFLLYSSFYPSLYSRQHNRSSLNRMQATLGVHIAIRASTTERIWRDTR